MAIDDLRHNWARLSLLIGFDWNKRIGGSMTTRIGSSWRNTNAMPPLLGLLCKGGMVAGPILLFFLIVPIVDWTVNGQRMSYSELWRSGAGLSAALFIGFVTLGTWGMVARQPWSRWALVLAPVLPIAAFPSLMISEPGMLVNAIVISAVIYGCLFHLKSVRKYLERHDNDEA